MSAVATMSKGARPLACVGLRRVCLVAEAAGGGVGRHFLDLASGLASRGIDVVAVYSPGRCDTLFRQRKAGIAGVRFVELPLRRPVGPWDATAVARLVRCLKKHGPLDILHGHSSKGGALARLAGRILGIPTVYTPHALVTLDPSLSRWKRSVYGRIERWLAQHSAGFIAVSQDEADHARSLGIRDNLVSVVANGIEPPCFPRRDEARRRLGFSDNDFVVGFVGRLVPQKAPDVLLEAFARLAKDVSHARLLLIGSGPLEAQLRDRIARLELGPKVLLTGDRVATDLMPAMDVFCLSSRYEGMTYVLLEALAAGLPIVATAVGGVSACVEEGVNGFVVPTDDARALGEAFLGLATSPETRRRFADAALKRAEWFTAERMIDDTLAIYEKVRSAASLRLAPNVAGGTPAGKAASRAL